MFPKYKPMEGISVLLLNLLNLLIFVNLTNGICPEICSCKKMSENSNNITVKCGGTPSAKITSFKDLKFEKDAENIIQLDLSKNQIANIKANDFANYTNLRRLDLSYNSLNQIDESMFGSIPHLERLKLSTNVIVHIFQGSFEKLKLLKTLDISSNPLACDCEIIWLVAWSNAMNVRLKPAPKCETPLDFKGSPLKKLRVGADLHCDSPFQPLLELKPNLDQLVFEGDEIVLRCRAPRVAVGAPRDSEDLPAKAHVFWGWSHKINEPNSTDDVVYKDPTKYFPSIQIDSKHLSDSGLLDSTLRIPSVTRNHSGLWDCRLRSQQANLSQTIVVLVISEKTKYCPALELTSNKGKYFWPRTIRGKLVRQPCSAEPPFNIYATHFCNDSGEWVNLNTSLCPYISENTRILETFAKVNLSIAKGSVLESAKRLRNYTLFSHNLKKLRDPIDVVFITKTLQNYLQFVRHEKDLGTMLLDIVSQILTLPEGILHLSQEMDNCGAKLIDAVETAAQYTPYIQDSSLLHNTDIHQSTHKTHLSIDFFNIRSDSFTGILCTWMRSELDTRKRIFQCNSMNQSSDIFNQRIDASIQIPQNFLHPKFSRQFMSQKLMVAAYDNGNFLSYNNKSNMLITSVLIGAKIISDSEYIYNVSESISLMLRVRAHHNKISAPIPVWWDPETNSWTSTVCQNSYYYRGLLVFSCNKLGYYGLLQNRKYLNDFFDENAGARFRFSPLGFYVGCSVLFLCVWINIVTYIFLGRCIQMARKQRHSLVNTWLATSALSFLFGVGIYQTENYRICQIIGISIHYFSLCVILWVCVSVSNMYKRLSKRNRIPTDDLPKENVGGKPILGIYLVGWGIAMIICGISGAVNMREYASYSHCFLEHGPSLSAIFVPSVILLLFLSILFLCVRCHIRTSFDQNAHFSENTQGTENVDLELLESTHNTQHFNLTDRSLTLSNPSTSILDDMEHTNSAQLRAHFVFLILFIISWISAASSVATPFKDTIAYEEEAFSIIFAIASSILGIFLLVFYSISRSDVRYQLSQLSFRNFPCCQIQKINGNKKKDNITVIYHQNCETMQSGSRSNSQCSKNRPSSARSNYLKEGNPCIKKIESPSKLLIQSECAGIVHINRQHYNHNATVAAQEIPNADIFYNPNQINVARKFFKKQKRLAKRNNFELQRQMERCDYGDGMGEISSTIGMGLYNQNRQRNMSIFSTGSKVNNTNIHVRGNVCNFSKEARQQSLNPNILSDSCNESDMIIDAEHLVLGTESVRVISNRNKTNNHEMIANIYTNVPETSQPQHEIVTMRADDKFRKSLNIEKFLEQDEIDLEHNDLNLQNDHVSTPLYVNGNIHNIVTSKMTESYAISSNNKDIIAEDNKIVQKHQEQTHFSPTEAMNTVGLPLVQTMSHPGVDSFDFRNSNKKENTLDLKLNEIFVSESIQINNKDYKRDSDILIRIRCKRISKSMYNLNSKKKQFERDSSKVHFHRYISSQIKSISCGSLFPLIHKIEPSVTTELQVTEGKQRLSSPVLFSPNLCLINDLPSPENRKKPLPSLDGPHSEAAICSQQSYIDSDSLNIFAQNIRRTFGSSPTCASDLNYQNSELSIQSHGLYAPQPDNDLNLTLTGDIYYPYQSSEVSEIDEADNDFDEENGFDDFNMCSNDCHLLSDLNEQNQNGSQSSIDELYERITRRPSPRLYDIGENNSITHSNLGKQSGDCEEKGASKTDEVKDTAEEDSSQGSIISYIDPNGQVFSCSLPLEK